MKVLEPLRTQSSPSRTAVVFSAARSEPPDGSVIAIAVTSSPVAHAGQPALLLLLGAEVDEVRRARRRRGCRSTSDSAALNVGELLGRAPR